MGALLPLAGLDPLTCAPFALLLAVRRTTAVAIAALALLPYAVLSALLPGGPPLWPLAAFAALAVALGVRRAAAG
ncbi:hypothetical protein ACFQV2_23250 [Actinokineospora soli]|uniref:Uncharacterized protein n=1 Tax=Actinokineospora soli TaxID=1048753 RepID=A0ABW2TQ73_9PSEU